VANYNSWDVSYSQIQFFENALNGHDSVRNVVRTKDILFTIERKKDLPTVRALLVNEYTLGLAAVLRAQREFPELNCVVTGANWNAYTAEAKDYGKQARIGVYVIGEFFGALWRADVAGYVKKDSHGNPIYRYRSA
jgi:hypothetical protein